MKPVMQTKSDNCLAACLASILECDINQFPEIPDETWEEVINGHLLITHGLQLLSIDELPKGVVKGYYIQVLELENGTTHATVYKDGKLVHDPSTTKSKGKEAWQIVILKHYED